MQMLGANIAGNKCRLVVAVNYTYQALYACR
ncbi:MAG: hypothetical protein GKR89_34545 [Candidatus Latescibacteria bacterium]|nr:hypothetical protein [Candidatus Latescibacterota bacterium]